MSRAVASSHRLQSFPRRLRLAPRRRARLRHVELRGCVSLTPGGLAAALGPHADTLEHLLVDDGDGAAAHAAACGGAAACSGPPDADAAQAGRTACKGLARPSSAELSMPRAVRDAEWARFLARVRCEAPPERDELRRPLVPVPGGMGGSAGEPGGALAPLLALVLRCKMLRSLRLPNGRQMPG